MECNGEVKDKTTKYRVSWAKEMLMQEICEISSELGFEMSEIAEELVKWREMPENISEEEEEERWKQAYQQMKRMLVKDIGEWLMLDEMDEEWTDQVDVSGLKDYWYGIGGTWQGQHRMINNRWIVLDLSEMVMEAAKQYAQWYKVDVNDVDLDKVFEFCKKDMQYWMKEGALLEIDQTIDAMHNLDIVYMKCGKNPWELDEED